MDEAKLGWVAGILDFQGHIVKKNNKTRATGSLQLTLYVETKIQEIIARLGEMTGTSPDMKNHNPRLREEWTRRGCAEHCPEAHVHSIAVAMPDIGRWAISGAPMAVILWNLQNFMVTTDEPWGWAMGMALASTRLSGQGSGASVAAIRRLAGLGWDLPPLMRDVHREITVTG